MTTEAEVAPVVDAVPAAEGEAQPAEAKKAEKSSAPVIKEVPKPDKPRLPKPDRTQLEGTIAVLQEAADNNQARIEELKRLIESKRDSRKNINAGTQETRARISELNAAFTAHMVSPPDPDRIPFSRGLLKRRKNKRTFAKPFVCSPRHHIHRPPKNTEAYRSRAPRQISLSLSLPWEKRE